MSAKSAAALRSESLTATIVAARGRRIRRRTRVAVLSLAVIGVSSALFFQNNRPTDAGGALAQPTAPSLAVAEKVVPSPVPRISTASQPPVARVTTSPTARVERVRGAEIAQLFPDQEIALVGENAFASTIAEARSQYPQ